MRFLITVKVVSGNYVGESKLCPKGKHIAEYQKAKGTAGMKYAAIFDSTMQATTSECAMWDGSDDQPSIIRAAVEAQRKCARLLREYA